LAELIKQNILGGESKPALQQPCFKHDRRLYLSDIPKSDNLIQKTNWLSLSKKILGGVKPRSPAAMFQARQAGLPITTGELSRMKWNIIDHLSSYSQTAVIVLQLFANILIVATFFRKKERKINNSPH